MEVKSITLQNFRNYAKKSFEFDGGVNLILGDNAVGKTNLLEAIYLLATGKGFRVKSVEREMIREGEQIARVNAKFEIRNSKSETNSNDQNSKEETGLEIMLTTGEVMGQKAGRKKYLVDGVAKRAEDFIGRFRAVLFGPEDLELITDSPSLRRRYLDAVLSQVDREYARSVVSYEKGLRARNKILEAIREEGLEGIEELEVVRKRLYFWDQLVIKNGDYIGRRREEYIYFLNKELRIKNYAFFVEYDKSAISPERLKQYEREEVLAASTLVGPHRDDFVVKIRSTNIEIRNNSEIQNFKFKIGDDGGRDLAVYGSRGEPFGTAQGKLGEDRDLSIYGSRGEQRLAVLWLKLGEMAFIERVTGDRPVLLLDDIFSELDEKHREVVLDLVGKQQTIITTADREVLEMKEIKGARVIELSLLV